MYSNQNPFPPSEDLEYRFLLPSILSGHFLVRDDPVILFDLYARSGANYKNDGCLTRHLVDPGLSTSPII